MLGPPVMPNGNEAPANAAVFYDHSAGCDTPDLRGRAVAIGVFGKPHRAVGPERETEGGARLG